MSRKILVAIGIVALMGVGVLGTSSIYGASRPAPPISGGSTTNWSRVQPPSSTPVFRTTVVP